MPDQDNVSLEKVSLDFTEDLDRFGIQDTQEVASRDLQTFLLADPDSMKEVEEGDDDEEEEKRKKLAQQKQQQASSKKDEKTETSKPKTEEKPDGKKALENLLFNKQEQTEEGSEEGAEGEGAGDESTYKTLGKDLMRLGVFSKNSEEETEENINIETPEQFLERFNLEKKKGAIGILDNFLSQFGEEYRKMFDAVFVNGVKPEEYLHSFAKIEAIKGLDMADEGNQEKVVRSYFASLKKDQNWIDNKIQKMKDYGDLEEESKTYHEVMLTKETEQATALELAKQEKLQKEREKEISTKKAYQRILGEKVKAQEIDGIPITEKESQEVLDYLTDKKYKLQSGELLSEFDKDILELNRPENHELKVKLGLLLRKKLDLTSVKKTTISKKSDALFTLSTKNAKQNSREKEIKSFF